MHDTLLRVLLGGVVVSIFSVLGDVVKPKSFAGLFGAAPSIAMATLALAVTQYGNAYASLEARSMMLGAVAFFLYASVVSRVLMHRKLPTLPVTCGLLMLWLGSALGLWYAVLR